MLPVAAMTGAERGGTKLEPGRRSLDFAAGFAIEANIFSTAHGAASWTTPN